MIPFLASLNPVFRMAAERNDLQVLGIASTLLFLFSFLGWIGFAYAPSNKARWEAAARLPLDDDDHGGDA